MSCSVQYSYEDFLIALDITARTRVLFLADPQPPTFLTFQTEGWVNPCNSVQFKFEEFMRGITFFYCQNPNHNSTQHQPNITLGWVRHENDFA